ncbi:hypothetical protein E3U43_012143 [Larimichthys crocea]|uniref:Uncharacterized protein n=1 Tax=Larimichthys crocea TaxID=215358 RepID=A0ACD3RTF6_LARCR|nr:hypothetical protein E3U43_012143 [Larimichthys crocea]
MANQDTEVKCFLSASTYRDDSTLCKQTRPPPRFPVHRGEPSTAVTVSASLTNARCESPWRAAAATRADSTLCCKDGFLFTTGRDTFTNHSEIHFCHFPLSYTRDI